MLFEIDKNECIFFEINSIKTNNINSIIKLFDGSVIIAKEGIKNFEIKKNWMIMRIVLYIKDYIIKIFLKSILFLKNFINTLLRIKIVIHWILILQ